MHVPMNLIGEGGADGGAPALYAIIRVFPRYSVRINPTPTHCRGISPFCNGIVSSSVYSRSDCATPCAAGAPLTLSAPSGGFALLNNNPTETQPRAIDGRKIRHGEGGEHLVPMKHQAA